MKKMIFAYSEINPENNSWVLQQKEWKNINSMDKIACDAVIHDLNSGYFIEVNGTCDRHFDEDAEATYWSNNNLYVEDDVFRIYIESDRYIFSHMYVTQSNKIIVVAVAIEDQDDFWDDAYVTEHANDLKPIYFMVEY